MKKIFAILLVMALMLAVTSCELIDSVFNPDPSADGADIADIKAAIENSNPKAADVDVKLTASLGTLNGSYNAVYNEDGSASVNYSYEQFNMITDESTELKSTKTGTATVSSTGAVSGNLGGIAPLGAICFNITLDETLVEIDSLEGGALYANVPANNTLSVIGMNIGCDAKLTISTGNGVVTSVIISYTSAQGPVEIVALYTY